MRLARQLGDEPQPVTVLGSVASEPKVSAKGFASFLLRLDSIEHRGTHDRLECDNPGAVERDCRRSEIELQSFRRGGAHRAAA